jgi:competence protein ComEA
MRRALGAVLVVGLLGLPRLVSFLVDRNAGPVPVRAPGAVLDTPPPPPAVEPAAAAGRAGEFVPASFRRDPLSFLSTAPADSLALLSGIGPVLASRIVDARRARGPFTSWDDVLGLRGIGPKTIERMKALASRP